MSRPHQPAPAASAAARPSPGGVRLPITLDLTGAAWTVELGLGSEAARVRLILDTGSSTLAVLPGRYDPAADAALRPTPLAQRLSYGAGSWLGPVLRTDLRLDQAQPPHHLQGTSVALIEAESTDFRGADGILGLAYRGLDPAHDLSALLPPGAPGTWPWPWATAQLEGPLAQQLQRQPRVTLLPPFSALERHGVVNDCFVLRVGRALRRAAASGSVLAENQGSLWLGADPQQRLAGATSAQTVRVLHDRYYNLHLQTLQVGDQAPLPAPQLAPADRPAYASNAILDSGCSFVLLEQSLWQGLLAGFDRIDSRLRPWVQRFQAVLPTQRGLPQSEALDTLPWPDLYFCCTGPGGSPTRLRLGPEHYWQRDALHPGEAWFMLLPQLPDWPRQSVLGLPLLCGHEVIFDRRSGGTGRVHFLPLTGQTD